MFEDLEGDLWQSMKACLRPQQVETHPSPHFYSDHAFEPSLFTLLRDHLPASECYRGMKGRTTNVRAQKARLALPLQPDTLGVLPEHQRLFWSKMSQFFRSAKFLRLAMSAYAPFIQNLRSDLITQTRFDIRFELLRDSTAYGISPHSDNPKKIMTLLFYLSAGEVSDALGTSLYVPKQDGFICKTGKHHERDDFDLHKTYPYAPNKVLSFLRTDTSFHGVEVIEEENVQRDVLRWMLWKA